MEKYDIDSIKIEGLKPTQEYSSLIEKEKEGEISAEDIRRILSRSYRIKDGRKNIQELLSNEDGTFELEDIDWGNPVGKEIIGD